jgi:UDP-N-acetylmuramoyl-L-alanyl-D-glutamate--2,6-diaminopimelate ligase
VSDAGSNLDRPAKRDTTRAVRDLVDGIATLESGSPDTRIALVTDDSRRVVPGALFVAKRGPTRDGASFIPDAIARGAAAVLTDADAPNLTAPVATLRAPDAALALARLAERFHHNPSSTVDVVGVTGTNGKTTTSTLLRHLLETSGKRAGLVSTCAIDAGPGRPLAKAMQTTPGAAELSERLAEMRDLGCAAAVVETSSHALDQKRVAGIRYKAAIFTNLTGDHLDYHKTMDVYADAKATLFAMLAPGAPDAFAIVNADDPYAARMVRDTKAPVVACALAHDGAAPSREQIESRLARRVAHVASVELLGYQPGGMNIRVAAPFGEIAVLLPLVGEHNAMNALQAACAAWSLGATRDAIVEGLETAPAPPGRLEPVTREPGVSEPFTVLVDYAHTDDALERALVAVRPLVRDGGSLRVVFGCGGDRDRTKRPRMGRVASRFADDVIVTSDNPRTEDPSSIVGQVIDGMDDRSRAESIVDREQAIRRAVSIAREGDVVLIAGKGHEDYQILADGRGGTITRHFDDREIARDALNDRFGAPSVEPKATAHASAMGEHQL